MLPAPSSFFDHIIEAAVVHHTRQPQPPGVSPLNAGEQGLRLYLDIARQPGTRYEQLNSRIVQRLVCCNPAFCVLAARVHLFQRFKNLHTYVWVKVIGRAQAKSSVPLSFSCPKARITAA